MSARPWDEVDWSHDPALAYIKGLQDGAALAADQYGAIAGVLLDALGAGGVDRLIRWRDQVAARGGPGWVS